MADTTSKVPRLTAEQRRAAAGQFERANQVLTTGNQEYGIQLLINCCQLDPASLIYRTALRKAVKAKYQNNMRGSRFAFLTNLRMKMRIRGARRGGDWLKVLEYGEQALLRNPWDVGVQLAMGEAFIELGLLDQAVWTLEQARQRDPRHLGVNRALAALYERRGNFNQAMTLWEIVRKAAPTDVEAQRKAKDLAASATIARGKYEEAIQGATSAREEGIAARAEATAARDEANAGTAERPTKETDVEHPVLGGRHPVENRCAREAAPLLARIKSDPGTPGPYAQLADVYRRADLLDQARAILVDGLGKTGNHFELAFELADLDIEPFRRDLAVTEQKLQKHPQDAPLSQIRSRLVKEINARELNLYRQKAERFPTETSHRFEVGIRLLRAGQIDEAIRELQQARTNPRYLGRALVYLGYCFKHRKNWKLAQRNFEEALQNLPLTEEALRKDVMFQIAHGCAEAGDLTRAVEMGFELANLDFSYRDIGRLLDEWQARLQSA